MASKGESRHGGQLVAESLEALGVSMVFGVPGIHALALWDGIRRLGLQVVVNRTELAATFAADGYARLTGRTGVVLLSTGPGALNSLTGIMEAARAHVPLLAITSQIPRALLGRGRGYLHELPGQLAVFSPIAKAVFRAETAEAVPGILAAAWHATRSAPWGPVVVEIPVDVLVGNTEVPALDSQSVFEPVPVRATTMALAGATRVLAGARRPVIWAGGGVLRSGASQELQQLAERLQAPVALTYMGKGALSTDHPLCLGSSCDDRAYQELLEEADVILCLGTELGAETTGQWTLKLQGRIVQVDAAPERMGATYPSLPVVSDVREFLRAVLELPESKLPYRDDPDAVQRVATARRRIRDGLQNQDRNMELDVLDGISAALGPLGVGVFDMTIAAYWAAAHLPVVQPNHFLYPLGSGTLGYALPAALGAALAEPERRVLAVVGDGGLQYALGELATMMQFHVLVTLLIIDDGAYGILREYQLDSFAMTYATDLHQPSFPQLAAAFGLPVCVTTPGRLATDLTDSLTRDGPNVVVLTESLRTAQPTS